MYCFIGTLDQQDMDIVIIMEMLTQVILSGPIRLLSFCLITLTSCLLTFFPVLLSLFPVRHFTVHVHLITLLFAILRIRGRRCRQWEWTHTSCWSRSYHAYLSTESDHRLNTEHKAHANYCTSGCWFIFMRSWSAFGPASAEAPFSCTYWDLWSYSTC